MTGGRCLGLAFVGAANLILCAASAGTPLPGRYCRHEAIEGLGEFSMQVDVLRRAGRIYVGFTNQMPDSQQILSADPPVRTSVMRDGSLRFRFDDGWGNLGEGRFRSNGTITLRVLRPSPDGGSNITRNYGTFRLSRSACSSTQARHN